MDESDIATMPDDQEVTITASTLRHMFQAKGADIQRMVEDGIKQYEDTLRAAMVPVGLQGVVPGGPVTARSAPAVLIKRHPTNPYGRFLNNPDDIKGLGMARFCRVFAAAQGNIENARRIAEKWRDETRHDVDDLNVRALNETYVHEGGLFVQPETSAELVELLQNATVVRKAGVQVVTSKTGAMEIPKEVSAPEASYVGETGIVQPTTMAFGLLTPQVKKLRAIIPVSNDFLKDASFASDVYIRNRLVRAHKIREDGSFLRSPGTDNTPKGLKYWAETNKFHANPTVNLTTVTDDLMNMLLAAEESNLDPDADKLVWFFAPRTKWFLMRLRDGNGNFAFKDEMVTGKLLDRPFFASNQVPRNINVDESEVTLASMMFAHILEREDVTIESIKGGAYSQNGQVVAGISTDQTVIVSTSRHDFYVTQETSVITMDQVTWGATA